jgi:hypothetical protein
MGGEPGESKAQTPTQMTKLNKPLIIKQRTRDMSIKIMKVGAAALLVGAVTATSAAYGQWFGGSKDAKAIPLQDVADMLHAVMDSDRAIYTQKVVQRLQNQEKVIKADEHFMDKKALPLPAQMFRFGAEKVGEKTKKFSYSLLSLWPVNKQNAPRTTVEKEGLKFVADNKGKNFYGEETLGGKKFFTAVYADTAVSPACTGCHNEHIDSPRDDFKVGDVMGGVVIRIPMN